MTGTKRYQGLKTVRTKLAGGAVADYYYDRISGKRIVGKPFTAEFDINYVNITRRKLLDVEDDQQPPTEGLLVRDVWKKFLKSPAFNNRAKATQNDLIRHMDVWLGDFSETSIKEISRKHVLIMRDKYIDKPRTAKHKMQTLGRLFSFAIDQGLVDYNPVAKVKVELSSRDEIWEPNDLKTFINSANPWVSAALILALLTGQRQDDVLTMRRSQIQNRSIVLKQAKTNAVIRLAFDDHPELEAFLEAWLAFQPESRDGTVLTGQRGRAWTGSGFRAEMTKAKMVCQSERIDSLAFLDLRRTATVELAMAGWAIRAISQVTGHADSSVLSVLQVYMPRGLLLADQGAKRERKRVEIVNGVAFQSNRMASLTNAWLKRAVSRAHTEEDTPDHAVA